MDNEKLKEMWEAGPHRLFMNQGQWWNAAKGKRRGWLKEEAVALLNFLQPNLGTDLEAKGPGEVYLYLEQALGQPFTFYNDYRRSASRKDAPDRQLYETIVQMHKDGNVVWDICNTVGCSTSTFYKVLAAARQSGIYKWQHRHTAEKRTFLADVVPKVRAKLAAAGNGGGKRVTTEDVQKALQELGYDVGYSRARNVHKQLQRQQ